jgi:hypothetical protein
MRKILAFLLLILVTLLPGILQAQESDYIPTGPYIQMRDISREAKIMQIREFKGPALFDYWGDCPELLMEYGFKRLIFEDIYLLNNLYHIELTEMQDSVAAFGAFSVAARAAAGYKSSFYEHSYLNDREALCARGNWFLRIHTLKRDTVNGMEVMENMSKLILSKMEGGPYSPPAILTAGSLRQFRSEIKLMKGYLGLYYGFPAWVKLFSGFDFREIAVLPLSQPGSWLNYARIVFANAAELEKFQKKNDFFDPSNPGFKKRITGPTYWAFLRIGENTALLLQSEGNDPFLGPIVEQIEKIGNKK